MNAVTCAKKIATPDPLQTDEKIAMLPRITPFQLICKGDWLLLANADYPAECPIFLGPSLRCKKCRFVTGRHQRAGDASQICFRAAARRKTTPDKSNV